jgi:hypothetical protein
VCSFGSGVERWGGGGSENRPQVQDVCFGRLGGTFIGLSGARPRGHYACWLGLDVKVAEIGMVLPVVVAGVT